MGRAHQSPSAALRSTGVMVALLSRAAASHRGAGDGQQSQVWRAPRDAMLCQGGGAGRGWGRRGSAESALIWELQNRRPGASSSSCSSRLRAALQTRLLKELCEAGAARGRHRSTGTQPLNAACVPAPALPTMSPFRSPSSPATAALLLLPAGTGSGHRSRGCSCKAGAISHPGHATLGLQLALLLAMQVVPCHGLPL